MNRTITFPAGYANMEQAVYRYPKFHGVLHMKSIDYEMYLRETGNSMILIFSITSIPIIFYVIMMAPILRAIEVVMIWFMRMDAQ